MQIDRGLSVESDAQRILNHDADNEFLRSIGVSPMGRYDNDPSVRPHLERASELRRQIAEFDKFRSK
jgi:hypothetical protein